MGRSYESLRDEALDKLKRHMDSLDERKGKKLAYWVRDYANFLNSERTFVPQKNVRYKRGSVIKVHLGFRIGSEEGGLHYAIVLDCNNQLSSPTVTVVPLTSIKPSTDLSKLHCSQLPLGSEIYDLLSQKANREISSLTNALEDINKRIDAGEGKDEDGISALIVKLKRIGAQIEHCNDLKDEINKMKDGSIALVGQITTISKIRIYDPKHKFDPLYGLRVSDKTLDLLDDAIRRMYTGRGE